jgi:hypothetical protein
VRPEQAGQYREHGSMVPDCCWCYSRLATSDGFGQVKARS